MAETGFLLASDFLMMAALLIPVPPRGRTALWVFMLGSIVTKWTGVGIGGFG